MLENSLSDGVLYRFRGGDGDGTARRCSSVLACVLGGGGPGLPGRLGDAAAAVAAHARRRDREPGLCDGRDRRPTSRRRRPDPSSSKTTSSRSATSAAGRTGTGTSARVSRKWNEIQNTSRTSKCSRTTCWSNTRPGLEPIASRVTTMGFRALSNRPEEETGGIDER